MQDIQIAGSHWAVSVFGLTGRQTSPHIRRWQLAGCEAPAVSFFTLSLLTCIPPHLPASRSQPQCNVPISSSLFLLACPSPHPHLPASRCLCVMAQQHRRTKDHLTNLGASPSQGNPTLAQTAMNSASDITIMSILRLFLDLSNVYNSLPGRKFTFGFMMVPKNKREWQLEILFVSVWEPHLDVLWAYF